MAENLKWWKGDTHLHTTRSDGNNSLIKLIKKSKKRGLEYIIITDHNANMHNIEPVIDENITIIPGIELTRHDGHMNMWGLTQPYDDKEKIADFSEFVKVNQEAYDKGALLCLNHPMCQLCPWRWPREGFYYGFIEVWNGPMRKDNLRAIDNWHGEVKSGKIVYAVGGSDYHKDYGPVCLIGEPTTRVLAASREQDDILDGLKKGRIIITRNARSSMLIITAGDAIIGDSVELTQDLHINVSVDKLKKGHILRLVDAEYDRDKNNHIYEYKARRTIKNFNDKVKVDKKGFVRAEIIYKKNIFGIILHKIVLFFKLRQEFYEKTPPFVNAMTNPIFIK